jgi:UDPglucose--hexose-1-phosphate uridylyltransferase
MSDLRKDPIVGRWVIIATDRAKRPQDFSRIEPVKGGGFCPFCKGNEGNTPHEILAYREPNTGANNPGWRVRVVPNKFPRAHGGRGAQQARRRHLRPDERRWSA